MRHQHYLGHPMSLECGRSTFNPSWLGQTHHRECQISTSGGFTPRWRGDGKELFYLSAGEDRRVIAVGVAATATNLRSGYAPSSCFNRARWQRILSFGYAVTSDGKRFLMAVPAGARRPTRRPLTVGSERARLGEEVTLTPLADGVSTLASSATRKLVVLRLPSGRMQAAGKSAA
jgi:hypothetical protein